MLELVDNEGKPEMFASFQGEGVCIGQGTFFIRCAKCNLQCNWCDTKYSWQKGIQFTTPAIVEMFRQSKMKTITITGGEPLLQQEGIRMLRKALHSEIYIETNGTITPELVQDLNFIVSPKLTNSGMRHKVNIQALKTFVNTKLTCMKFVVTTPNDVEEALGLCEHIGVYPYTPIVFQPEGSNLQNSEVLRTLWCYILDKSQTTRFDIRFLPQWHVVVFGQKRGV
jgi:7-carboxy-7-deazaguanine synthase